MKLLEFAAWSMIWLVVMLPVCFAQQMTVQKFSGADGVNGFARENDELTVQVLAQMIGNPTPDVAKQRVRVFYGDTYYFMDSCTAQSQAMQQCTYKTQDLIFAGTDHYAIKLFDAENKEIETAYKNLTVDFIAPKILVFTLSPNMSMAPKPTTVTYRAEDYGSETGKLTECSGIKFINITANLTTVGLIAGDISACAKNGTFTFTPPSPPGGNGKVRICAVATDYLNHKSAPVCKDIFMDSRKPTPEALELRDADGYLITHARTNQQVTADVFVKIADSDVNGATVYADLTKLNPTLGRKVREGQNGEWFFWRNVAITTPATCQVTVNASDLMGSKDSKTLQCSISIDDTSPEPTAMGTQFVDDTGKSLLGVNGTIFAEFKEAGAGMSKGLAFLDLRSLGLGASVQAQKCEKAGTETWKCFWAVRPTSSSGNYSVKIMPTTRDNLNNQVTKTMQLNLTFDKTAPEGVRIVEIAAFRAEQRVKTNFTSLGETLEFVVEGAGFNTVVADLRDIGGDKETPAERCLGNTTKRCTFSYTNEVSGPQPTNITFTFSDLAGNSVTITTSELFILGIGNETEPNYWTLSTECSPTMLDRSTLSVYEHPVYCRIKLASTNDKASLVTMQAPGIDECSGQTDYISTMSIENNYAGSVEPYMVMTLAPTDYTINELNFSCPVSILTRVGNFIPQNFEHDNVTVTLQFYNLPVGELYNNMDDNIDEVKESISGVWKVIGELQKFMGYAEKICQILNILMNIVALLTMIQLVTGILGEVLSNIPFTKAPGEALKQTSSNVCNIGDKLRIAVDKDDGILSYVQKFCDFITCQRGLMDMLSIAGVGGAEGAGTEWNKWMSTGLGSSSLIGGAGTGAQDPSTYLNVKDSLIFSIVVPPLCVPGIIYNLDKWRQIQCQYGNCLLTDVRENGLPASYCRDQKHYLECRFVLGEIFNLIPFAPLVNYYLNMLQNILSNPLAIIGAIAGLICGKDCGQGTGVPYWLCAGLAIASQLGKTIQDIQNFKTASDFGSVNQNACNDFEDAVDDYESETNA
jgi:hypothetical protein